MQYKNLIILLALILVSCGGDQNKSVEDIIASQDLEKIRKKKAELDAQQRDIVLNIQQLEAEIKKLDPQEKITLITTLTASETQFNHFLELQGDVTTKQNIVIYPEFSGVLTRVFVKEGQQVSKGQVLAKIDDGGLNQQLAQMQIQADLAKTTFERQKRLWEQNIGSEIQFLQAKSNYEAQAKAVGQMEQQIAKTRVTAPFSGTIDDVITEQGNVIAPGQTPLFRLVNLNDMYIETDVPERYLVTVTEGKPVQVEFPVLGTSVETVISQAGNFIDPANRTFKVQVNLPKSELEIKPNLTAKLKINDYTNETAILIPMSIISENSDGQQYVYTVEKTDDQKGVARRTFIETGLSQGDMIEVLSGISTGQEIVQEGARSVQDNQEVKILNTYNQ